MKRLLLVLMIATLTAAVPVRAEHPEYDPDVCHGSIGGMYLVHNDYTTVQTPRLGPGMIIPIVDPATGPFYLDVREVASEYYLLEIYMYAESNAQPGLQRGAGNFPGTMVDHCWESPNPDMMVF